MGVFYDRSKALEMMVIRMGGCKEKAYLSIYVVLWGINEYL